MWKKLVAVAMLAGFVGSLTACNTVAGAGADVKATGQAIENAADKRKTY
jgi:predicted small secreted protein